MFTRVNNKEDYLKTGELLKLFRNNGIIFIRHGASHDIYYSPISESYITVPRHSKEIPSGTAARILKDAGLNKEKSNG